jgi:hypothetical protein
VRFLADDLLLFFLVAFAVDALTSAWPPPRFFADAFLDFVTEMTLGLGFFFSSEMIVLSRTAKRSRGESGTSVWGKVRSGPRSFEREERMSRSKVAGYFERRAK